MSLSSLLPTPTNAVWDREDERRLAAKGAPQIGALVSAKIAAPPYGCRKDWVPRTEADFGDGGAFPEIHVAQYPLGLGAPGTMGKKSDALAVRLDDKGKIKYDAIARQGHGKDKVVYSSISQLLPAEVLAEDADELQRPDEESVAETTEETRLALEKLTNQKITSALPVRHAQKAGPAQYIRIYTVPAGRCLQFGGQAACPSDGGGSAGSDEPPKFRINKKIPRGYTIPLDKRLAADGRGLQQVHINEKFAKMAEALYIADRKAREAVEARAQLEKKLAQKEKEKKEDMLRMMAQRAREERAGLRNPETASDPIGGGANGVEARERNDLRAERQRERQRDRNLQRAAPEKRSKLQKERERDISEQIALGLPAKSAGNGETLFDQRLFNTTKGMDSGYGDDEAYNVYDKPWRDANTLGNHIYRPSKQADSDNYGGDLDAIVNTKRFVPDKQFSGASRETAGAVRSGPVEFEKEEDPFGLDQFLNMAKKAPKRAEEKSERNSQSERKRSRRD
ncbi:GL12909 [Drosophila persimilis]|uniref:GL12909 n=1 Tax=Drosophila persimilis TaxID=7234 RepID=B4GV39_DROPE|nr:GL12909 [Drosophila persimilis]